MAEAQTLVEELGVPIHLSLDHDLGWRPAYPDRKPSGKFTKRIVGWFRPDVIVDPTGLDFADWFAWHTLEGGRLSLDFVYYIHTANDRARPILRDRMFRLTRQEPAGYENWWAQ